MSDWLKVLGEVKDQSLILLGVIVLAVLWLCFRLLQYVVQAQVSATASIAGELKTLSRDVTELTSCTNQMLRHQEQCARSKDKSASGGT